MGTAHRHVARLMLLTLPVLMGLRLWCNAEDGVASIEAPRSLHAVHEGCSGHAPSSPALPEEEEACCDAVRMDLIASGGPTLERPGVERSLLDHVIHLGRGLTEPPPSFISSGGLSGSSPPRRTFPAFLLNSTLLC